MSIDASPEDVRAAELTGEFKREWSRKDRQAMLRVLRDLAPLCEYRGHELARVLGVTRRHVQRIFAVTVGCPPQHWLKQQRLLAARELLVECCSIKEIAYGLGFRRASQFSRDFRCQFGVPPSSFLREPLLGSRRRGVSSAVDGDSVEDT